MEISLINVPPDRLRGPPAPCPPPGILGEERAAWNMVARPLGGAPALPRTPPASPPETPLVHTAPLYFRARMELSMVSSDRSRRADRFRPTESSVAQI